MKEKLKESFLSVLPVALLVLLVSVLFVPLSSGIFLSFLVGVAFLTTGTTLFEIGADASMLVIGQKVGLRLSKSKSVWLVAFVSFVIGAIVTVAEPDLQILAEQVQGVNSDLLVYTVSIGVGIFLTVAMLRIVFGLSFSLIVGILYPLTFLALMLFTPRSFWALAFDAGGVTTGPVTVPFIISLGVGVSQTRSRKQGDNDSFGLVALASLGPIVAVLVLGIILKVEGGTYVPETTAVPQTTYAVANFYGKGVLHSAKEVALALSPVIAFFLFFEIVTISFSARQLTKILIGLAYTFVGLTLFLTGANVGFMPVGTEIGTALADKVHGILLVPVGAVLGYFVVSAEPSVYILNKQVEKLSAGAVTAKTMKKGLCIGVSTAIGLSMLRIVLDFNVMFILIPGYLTAICLMPFTPKMFTGIAYDSGGVASGAMVSSFALPMAIGACSILAPDKIMTLAFGTVALVALAPIVSIQILGMFYKRKTTTFKRTFLTEDDGITEYEVA